MRPYPTLHSANGGEKHIDKQIFMQNNIKFRPHTSRFTIFIGTNAY